MDNSIKKCKCGCGEMIVIKPYHRYRGVPDFIQGHASRMPGHFMPTHNVKHSEESKRKISENHARLSGKDSPMYGKHHSEETKTKMSKARMGKYCGKDNPQYGKVRTEEEKQHQSEVMKGKYAGDKNPFYNKKHSPETIEKIRAKAIKRNADPEYREMISECTKEKMTPEIREHLSEINKERCSKPAWRKMKSEEEIYRWKNDKEFAKRMRTSRNAKPNKSEIKLNNILDEIYPGEWKFTGDFSFMLNGKNPDFVNCNGKKLIIELFGEPWHKGETQEDRAKFFSPFGYRTLVVWWKELQNKEYTVNKIRRFVNDARV